MNQYLLRALPTALLLSVLFSMLLGEMVSADSAPSPTPPYEEVTIKPISQRPCLLMDAAELSIIKKRLEALPNQATQQGDSSTNSSFVADPKKMDSALYALLYGNEDFKKEVSAEFIANVRADFPLQIGGTNGIANNVKAPGSAKTSSYRRYNETLLRYDLIEGLGCLTDEEKMDFRERMIAGAIHFVGDDPAKFPKFGNDNRSLDQALVGGLVGLSFPDHPLSKAWVSCAANLTHQQLENAVWDGAWNEVPRYHNWTMLLYSNFLPALQRRTGIDFYSHPNMKALLDWYVRFSSPLVRLPGTTSHNPAGEPTLPVWGDSNYGPYFQVCAMYAPHYAESDPDFSKRLMWMWRRAGSPFQHGWQFDMTFPLQVDPMLPDAPQILGSDFCRRFGYVLMRSGFNTPDETVVYMRGGERGVLHPRSDLGSIDLFSQGIPLALGSESGPYGEGIEWNRSQISNNDVVFGGKSRDRRESSGHMDAWFTCPEVDYAVADCSRPVSRWVKAGESFHWRRHLLLVKNPDYLVIWDEISSPMTSEWYLHTTGEKLIWGKDLITSKTAYNADLDIHVLLPADPLVPNEKEGRFGSSMEDPKHPGSHVGKADPYPFDTLKYFSIPAKPDQDFLTVLHPRKPDGAPITTTLISSSEEKITLKVTHGTSTDLITLGIDGAIFQRDEAPAISIPMAIKMPDVPSSR